MYEEAQRLTKETGIPHEVDHDLPLNGKYVSGLHVFENLRVVTRNQNRTKSNRFSVDDVCWTAPKTEGAEAEDKKPLR